jgi:hypothetical protein
MQAVQCNLKLNMGHHPFAASIKKAISLLPKAKKPGIEPGFLSNDDLIY